MFPFAVIVIRCEIVGSHNPPLVPSAMLGDSDPEASPATANLTRPHPKLLWTVRGAISETGAHLADMLFPREQENSTAVRRRVAVTGAGIVTAFGTEWKANAAAFEHGRNGFRNVTLFDVARQRAKIAAEVDLPVDDDAYRFGHWRSRELERRLPRMDRASKLLLLAAGQAWAQCEWTPDPRLPIVLGTTSGGMANGEAYFKRAIQSPDERRGQPTRAIEYQVQRQALDLACAVGSRGPQILLSDACASGANAVGHGFEMVRSGAATRVLVGGYDALSLMTFAGFDSLQALSTTRCRPLDRNRDGLGLGEGAAVFALEPMENAVSRGAPVMGEIAGYATCHDVHHLTQPHPDGVAAARCMREACNQAEIGPAEVQYVNAHGTGTPLNDRAELRAIEQWAGSRASRIFVSSVKSSIGHLLGAAGAVEAGVCLMALQGQWVPPTGSLENLDSDCGFQAPNRRCPTRLEWVLSNSFGFGGANSALVLRRTG